MLKRIVISLIGFYVFWLFVLPLIMGYAISSISDKISHNSNYEIKLTNPSVKLSVLPTVTFMVGEVSLVSKKDSIKTKIENNKWLR